MSVSFLEVPGGRLAYEVTGPADGPLVVAVHGMGSNRHIFRLLTPSLVAAGYRVAALDLRGHGESSTGWPAYDAEHVAGDVLALVDALGGPAVLIGSSVASAAVTFAAARSPERVRALVLIGASAQQNGMNPLLRLAATAITRSTTLWGMYVRMLYPSARPADFATDTRRLLGQLRQPGRMLALRRVLDPTTVWWTEVAPKVTCPVQVVMGTRDPDFPDPRREAQVAADAFNGAADVDLVLVEGAGHYPFTELPGQTNPAIVAFLGRVLSA